MHVEDGKIETLPRVDPGECFARRRCRAGLHAPLGCLQLEHAAIRRVVVDDQEPLALEYRLDAEERPLPRGRELAERRDHTEAERRALAFAVARRPHLPAHQFRETLADRETEAGA